METHKLSRPPSKNFGYIQSIPLPSPSKHPVDLENLELGERLDSARGLGVNLKDVEANLEQYRVSCEFIAGNLKGAIFHVPRKSKSAWFRILPEMANLDQD
jgi:hypothetical protein